MAYRCTVHQSTGQSPALFVVGRELRHPFDINIPLTHDAFIAQKIVLQQDTLEMAQQHLKSQHANQVRYYELQAHGSPYQPSDRVVLHQPQHARGVCSKWHIPWVGPFTVQRSLRFNNVYEIVSERCDPSPYPSTG